MANKVILNETTYHGFGTINEMLTEVRVEDIK